MNERRAAIEPQRPLGCLLAAAIIAAPFLALLYDPAAGLAVAAAALAVTAYLAWDATRRASGIVRKRLLIAATINAALAVTCLGALAVGVGR